MGYTCASDKPDFFTPSHLWGAIFNVFNVLPQRTRRKEGAHGESEAIVLWRTQISQMCADVRRYEKRLCVPVINLRLSAPICVQHRLLNALSARIRVHPRRNLKWAVIKSASVVHPTITDAFLHFIDIFGTACIATTPEFKNVLKNMRGRCSDTTRARMVLLGYEWQTVGSFRYNLYVKSQSPHSCRIPITIKSRTAILSRQTQGHTRRVSPRPVVTSEAQYGYYWP